jgi:hypothetical protein
MHLLKEHCWEATHITVIAAVIIALTLLTDWIDTPGKRLSQAASDLAASTNPGPISAANLTTVPSPNPAAAVSPSPMPDTSVRVPPISSDPTALSPPDHHSTRAHSQHTAEKSQSPDPREISLGAPGISNRYRLVSVERKSGSSGSDELTVKLHVQSLATENMVSPYESGMLEIKARISRPSAPSLPFALPSLVVVAKTRLLPSTSLPT